MPVNYYHTDYGIFSVIVGNEYFNWITSLGRGYVVDQNGVTQLGYDVFAIIPNSSLAGVVGISAAATEYDADRYLLFNTYFPRVSIKQVAATQSATFQEEFYDIPGFALKKAKVRARLDVNRAWELLQYTSFVSGANSYNAPYSDIPYGSFHCAATYGTKPDYIDIGFLVANDDMSQFAWVTFVCGYNALNCIYFDHNTSPLSASTNTFLQQLFDGVIPDSDDPGGGGDDDDDDPYSDVDGETDLGDGDTIAIPNMPGLSATDAGIIGLFVPSVQQMQDLADFMWTDFGGTGTTVEDILSEIVEALKRSISNPLDYVLGLNIIPSQGLSVGANKVIRFGFVSSGVSMPRLSDQYFSVDCGSLSFDAVCGDTFLDYAPYSKFSIYLPYIGVREVDANDFVGHTIGVVYHGDVITGGITAYVTKDGSVMYQYSGSCALNVPLSADNWGNTISAAVNVATAIVAGKASAGAAGVAKAVAQGAASVAANPSLLSPQVAHSGAVSGSAGCMGVQVPFVIREAVRFHSTENFNKFSGYPSFYYKALSDMSGYTRVLDLHLHDIPATQEEVQEIESILKEGAIF